MTTVQRFRWNTTTERIDGGNAIVRPALDDLWVPHWERIRVLINQMYAVVEAHEPLGAIGVEDIPPHPEDLPDEYPEIPDDWF